MLLAVALIHSLILPICFIIAYGLNLKLIVYNYFYIVCFLAFLMGGVAFLLWNINLSKKTVGRLTALLLPVSLLNACFCMICERTFVMLISVVGYIVVAILLFKRFASTTRVMIISAIIFMLMIIPAMLLLLVVILAFSMKEESSNRTIQAIKSPEHTYVAEVISSD